MSFSWEKPKIYSVRARIGALLGLGLALLLGCSLSDSPAPPTPLPATALQVQDASALFYGSCFEALRALDGQQLVLQDAVSLELFYNLLDQHCESPVLRGTVDFNQQVLLVAVKVVTACDAALEFQGLAGQTLTLRFRQAGECNYEVVAGYFGLLPRSAGVQQIAIQ